MCVYVDPGVGHRRAGRGAVVFPVRARAGSATRRAAPGAFWRQIRCHGCAPHQWQSNRRYAYHRQQGKQKLSFWNLVV